MVEMEKMSMSFMTKDLRSILQSAPKTHLLLDYTETCAGEKSAKVLAYVCLDQLYAERSKIVVQIVVFATTVDIPPGHGTPEGKFMIDFLSQLFSPELDVDIVCICCESAYLQNFEKLNFKASCGKTLKEALTKESTCTPLQITKAKWTKYVSDQGWGEKKIADK